jgi:DNA adenine methylase
MKQMSFFDEPALPIVNIASIPHRSPFRYPGGKTWFVPYIRRWLAQSETIPDEFVEPFSGGAIVGLTVAFERLAKHVTLIELDANVAAVWQILIEEGCGPSLAQRILSFEMTEEHVKRLLATQADNLEDIAFQTIIKNRVNRGGILASGAGRMKAGENGRGLASRWYPKTLHNRIMDIHALRNTLSFFKGDALQHLKQYKDQANVVFFIDPPYTLGAKKPGSRLYDHSELNHEAMFDLLQEVKGDFLMTYDNQPYVQNLATQHGFDTHIISMKNTHHAKQKELLIGRNLSWAK